MKCPHCRVDFHDKPTLNYIGEDKDGHWGLVEVTCSACRKFVLFLQNGAGGLKDQYGRVLQIKDVLQHFMVYPRGSARPPVPADVPKDIAEDYSEACLVLADSPKASAALSRRCLQHVLRTAAGVKSSDLASEIQQVLDNGRLPSHLAESIDAIRNIGNFSAHPIKSKSTGEILPVEVHEAEWNLDVLEALFDFYYVQPALLAKKRAALDAKLGVVDQEVVHSVASFCRGVCPLIPMWGRAVL
jgi:hypothetical protein